MPPTIQPKHIRALQTFGEAKNTVDQLTGMQHSWIGNAGGIAIREGPLMKQTGTGGGYTTGTGWEILEGAPVGTVKEASETLNASSAATVTLEGAIGAWPTSPHIIKIGAHELTCTGVTGNGTATAKLTGCRLIPTGTVKEASEALSTGSSATVTLEGALGTWPTSPIIPIKIGSHELTYTGVTANGTATPTLTGCKLVSGTLTAAEAKGLAVNTSGSLSAAEAKGLAVGAEGGKVAIRAGIVAWFNPHTGTSTPVAFACFDASGNVRQTLTLAGIAKYKANGEAGEEAGYSYW